MTDQPLYGEDWTDWQNDLVVAEYFEIAKIQAANAPINKAQRYRDLGVLIGRNPGSVSQKLHNVSAVLDGLEMAWTRGLKPRANLQQSLIDAVERYLDFHPQLVFGSAPAAQEGLIEEESPPPLGKPKPVIDRKLERIARKYNYAERDFRNRALGRSGEEAIFLNERRRLAVLGKEKLSEKVEWTARDKGDGVGYDIKSFDASGAELLIEVKTTNGPRTTDFFLSKTEFEVAKERPDAWRLYRLHSFSKKPGLFVLPPPLSDSARLSVENWRVQVG